MFVSIDPLGPKEMVLSFAKKSQYTSYSLNNPFKRFVTSDNTRESSPKSSVTGKIAFFGIFVSYDLLEPIETKNITWKIIVKRPSRPL